MNSKRFLAFVAVGAALLVLAVRAPAAPIPVAPTPGVRQVLSVQNRREPEFFRVLLLSSTPRPRTAPARAGLGPLFRNRHGEYTRARGRCQSE